MLPLLMRPQSRRQGWKIVGGLVGSILLLLLMMMINLTQGQAHIRFMDMVHTVFYVDGTAEAQMILVSRLPRAVAGLLCGAALAVAGVLLQAVLRNPLASAGTLGINAGAYFAVVVGTVFFPALASRIPIAFALVGGLAAVVMVYMLAGGNRSTPIHLVLAGMIVTLLLSSFTSVAQILFLDDARHLFAWGSGSLEQNNWDGILSVWFLIVIGLAAAFSIAKFLNLLELGEESAASLGQRIQTTKRLGIGIAVVLATISVSIAGPIGFIGLLVPHLVRLMGFRNHKMLIPLSAILGSALLLGADALTYSLQATYGNLPVGAVTAAIGGPWLIWIVLRMAKTRSKSSRVNWTTTLSVGSAARKTPFWLLYTVLGILLLSLLGYGCMIGGDKMLSIKQLLLVFSSNGDDLLRHIVWNMRLPRMAAALFGGAALAVAGLLIQGAVRNPMADPSVIGVTSGAGVGVLSVLAIWPYASGAVLAISAFVGAIGAAALVFALAWRSGFSPGLLILAGISVTAVGSAIIQFLVLQSSSYTAALIWLAGSTYARGWSDTVPLIIVSLFILPLAWWLGRRVELLAFDDSVSLGVGLRVHQARLVSAGIGVALASVVVATVGTVGFIGLLAPHAARFMSGHHHRRTFILAALIGAVLLMAADISGRLIALPKEISSGLMVSLIGTPYLIYLLKNGGRKSATRI